jgi:hypothetical protein
MYDLIKKLAKKYPNDLVLGNKIRTLINECGDDLEEIQGLKYDELVKAGQMKFEESTTLRNRRREIIKKIEKIFSL